MKKFVVSQILKNVHECKTEDESLQIFCYEIVTNANQKYI